MNDVQIPDWLKPIDPDANHERWELVSGGWRTKVYLVLQSNIRVSRSVRLERGVVLEQNVWLEGGVRLAQGVCLGQGVLLGQDVHLEQNVQIPHFARINSGVIVGSHKVAVILGSAHSVTHAAKGVLCIGCETRLIAEWLQLYEEIGKARGYSLKKIEEYAGYIRMFAMRDAEMYGGAA